MIIRCRTARISATRTADSSPGGENDQVFNDNGDLIHDGQPLEYIADDKQAPESVNPSLWRQSQLVRRCGLYKVVDGLYQVRFAVNLTIVDAPDGLVIIDTTTSADLAKAGLELFRRELGNNKPIVAIIYTHTHFDHYAGVKGLVDEADVASGKIPVVAPGTIESFNKFAIGGERHHWQCDVTAYGLHLRFDSAAM